MAGRCPNGGSFGCPTGTPCKFANVCERVGFWVPHVMAKEGHFILKVDVDIPSDFKDRLIQHGFETVSDREFILYPATDEEIKEFDRNCPYQA